MLGVGVYGDADFDNCTFIKNTCSSNGGAIDYYGGQGLINNSKFIENYSSQG